MNAIDVGIILVYFGAMAGIGFYFMRRQESCEQYFVGSRQFKSGHIGFSVVATDVGGGFSIGLGGLGFAMGISGSWLLFSGLLGAWISAVFLIPKIKMLGDRFRWTTYADYLAYRFDERTRTLAAIVSGLGYAAFVGAQILAGGKLVSIVFEVNQTFAVLIMAMVVILYTGLGGIRAVIFTDSIQWIILLLGLSLFAIPLSLQKVGGMEGLIKALPASHLSLTNLTFDTFFTWLITILPIWFVANTLYQRIYACRDVKTAKRAWFLAGFLEWPAMAFLGCFLGMIAYVLFPQLEAELGVPMLIKTVLPAGVLGIVLAAYFSAIMSTADSCLLASVGHWVSDIYQKQLNPEASSKKLLRLSQVCTFLIGILSIAVALYFPKVLDAVLVSYAFMVSGLFVPTLAGLISKKVTSQAAFSSMVAGGGSTILLHAYSAMIKPVSDLYLALTPLLISGFFLWLMTYLAKIKELRASRN